MALKLFRKAEKEKSKRKEEKKQEKVLNAHTFRALNQQFVARAAEDEEEDEPGEAEAANAPQNRTFPGHQFFKWLYRCFFNANLRAFYHLLAPLNDVLLRLRPRRPAGRPIRALRMTTMISQGGVAKVALQTLLRIPPEQVQTSVLVFGPKQPIPPSLQARTDITIISTSSSCGPAPTR
jgi:hypothetical protein